MNLAIEKPPSIFTSHGNRNCRSNRQLSFLKNTELDLPTTTSSTAASSAAGKRGACRGDRPGGATQGSEGSPIFESCDVWQLPKLKLVNFFFSGVESPFRRKTRIPHVLLILLQRVAPGTWQRVAHRKKQRVAPGFKHRVSPGVRTRHTRSFCFPSSWHEFFTAK